MKRLKSILYEGYNVLADFGQNRGGVHSAQIAFYMMLSIFPMLTSIVAIMSFFQVDIANAMAANAQLFPLKTREFILSYVLNVKTSGNILLLLYSVLLTIWSSSKAMYAIQYALDKVYDQSKRKHYVLNKLLSILYNFFFILFLILIILTPTILQIGMGFVEKYVLIPKFVILNLTYLRYIIQFGAMFLIICLIYMRLPTRKKRLRSIWPGALFTTLAWIIASYLFTFFMENFSKINAIYGALNVFILLSLWFNLNATLLLIGSHYSKRYQFRKEHGTSLYHLHFSTPTKKDDLI